MPEDRLLDIFTHLLAFVFGNLMGQNIGYNRAREELIPVINALQAENYKIKQELQECKAMITYQQSQIQAIIERQEELSEQMGELLLIIRQIIEGVMVPKPSQKGYYV
jgi:chromosome segregation ATPase